MSSLPKEIRTERTALTEESLLECVGRAASKDDELNRFEFGV